MLPACADLDYLRCYQPMRVLCCVRYWPRLCCYEQTYYAAPNYVVYHLTLEMAWYSISYRLRARYEVPGTDEVNGATSGLSTQVAYHVLP
eukprot:2729418-Rhodomonas_salina.2